jgi:hypothetical protein
VITYRVQAYAWRVVLFHIRVVVFELGIVVLSRIAQRSWRQRLHVEERIGSSSLEQRIGGSSLEHLHSGVEGSDGSRLESSNDVSVCLYSSIAAPNGGKLTIAAISQWNNDRGVSPSPVLVSSSIVMITIETRLEMM